MDDMELMRLISPLLIIIIDDIYTTYQARQRHSSPSYGHRLIISWSTLQIIFDDFA